MLGGSLRHGLHFRLTSVGQQVHETWMLPSQLLEQQEIVRLDAERHGSGPECALTIHQVLHRGKQPSTKCACGRTVARDPARATGTRARVRRSDRRMTPVALARAMAVPPPGRRLLPRVTATHDPPRAAGGVPRQVLAGARTANIRAGIDVASVGAGASHTSAVRTVMAFPRAWR